MNMNIPDDKVRIRQAKLTDIRQIANYLRMLSDATKKRFAPHAFDEATLGSLLSSEKVMLFVAMLQPENEVIAYSIVQKGSLEHDQPRLQSYGISPDPTDCTLAPSVADEWQSRGIGTLIHQFVVKEIKNLGFKRIILWGGVQASNIPAVRFYQKHQYHLLGEFHYNGLNYDMILEL